MSRELFVKTLLSDFFNSLILWLEVGADFQTFIGEYPNKVSLEAFPHCPIWYDIRKYLELVEFC